MILQLLPGDLYNVCEGAREFYSEMKLPGTFNAEKFQATWAGIMNLNVGTIFASFNEGTVTGAIGSIIFPDPYNGDLVATEAFWYIRPSHRGGTTAIRLMNEFEAWAKRRGASRIMMGALANSPPKVIELFKRRGYQPLETHFVRCVA